MLSRNEIDERVVYYTEIFGSKKILRIKKYNLASLWPIKNYYEKVDGLRERGFTEPEKLIQKLPQILGFSFQNIDRKIEGLRERGFKDPILLIVQLPQVLNLSLQNIDRKMKLCRRLHGDAYAFVTYSTMFISMSPTHYIPALRACRRAGLEPSPRNVVLVYRTLTQHKRAPSTH